MEGAGSSPSTMPAGSVPGWLFDKRWRALAGGGPSRSQETFSFQETFSLPAYADKQESDMYRNVSTTLGMIIWEVRAFVDKILPSPTITNGGECARKYIVFP